MNHTKTPAANESSPFLQKHSALIRIWHWLTFFTITTMITTVLLASTALNPRQNIKLVQEQLASKGVNVTDEQAFSVSHSFDDKMWDIHKLVGFGLAFLLLSRIIIEVAQPTDEKMGDRLKRVLSPGGTSEEVKLKKHYLTVKRGYYLFYVLLLVIVLTGLGIAFGHDLAFLDHNHRLIMQVHSFCQYLMYGFVILHLCGVIIADITHSRGIVSGMINGNNG